MVVITIVTQNNGGTVYFDSPIPKVFDVKGKPYEKVRYNASSQQPFRDCSTDSYVNSITLCVKNKDGELFDFKGMPIEYELELN